MKSITYKENSFKGRLLCLLFGHKFMTTKFVTDHFKEFECTVCHLQVTNDLAGETVSLTQEHREINEALISLHKKRHSPSLENSVENNDETNSYIGRPVTE
jgi:hypothetical protein